MVPHRLAAYRLGIGEVSYSKMLEMVGTGARNLHDVGLRPGDRVLLAVEPGPEWMPVFFSILEASLVAVLLPHDAPLEVVAQAAR